MRILKRLTIRQRQCLFVLLPLLMLLLLLVTYRFWIWLSAHLPPCAFYRVTGFYCPGCGNSRSVRALLEGRLIDSLRYNISPLLFLTVAGLRYAEIGCCLFGRPRKLLPRKPIVVVPAAVLFGLYFIVRNIWEFMPC